MQKDTRREEAQEDGGWGWARLPPAGALKVAETTRSWKNRGKTLHVGLWREHGAMHSLALAFRPPDPWENQCLCPQSPGRWRCVPETRPLCRRIWHHQIFQSGAACGKKRFQNHILVDGCAKPTQISFSRPRGRTEVSSLGHQQTDKGDDEEDGHNGATTPPSLAAMTCSRCQMPF